MSRKRQHAAHEEEHENHERWLISYADMITLLMVFFIVLFSMSSLDSTKYRAIAESFAAALGGGPAKAPPISEDGMPTAPKPDPSSSNPAIDPEADKEDLAKKIEEAVKDAGLEMEVKVITDERGVVLILTNSLLFKEGDAQILPAGLSVLSRLTPLLSKQDKPLVIEGHTDSQPIATPRFPSNWELSTTRATQVLRFLLGRGVSSKDLTAAGYADTHPRASNSTAQGQSDNRRVEIILVVKPDRGRPAVGMRAADSAATPQAPSDPLPAPTPESTSPGVEPAPSATVVLPAVPAVSATP